MYFVDLEKMDQTSTYFNNLLSTYEQATFESNVELFGLERIVHMTIEAIVDIGNMMIDGFIMRDPGSYEDVIDILVDEQVITADQEDAFKQVIGLRGILVKDYMVIDHPQLQTTLDDSLPVLKQFTTQVYRYLEKEMGPITAFKKREGDE
ncbi:DUF86 domain-containing protein [Alkalibacillus almallahensis]|uniref:DUF86 domain-containing protein n=1 Tax=Alkalibacillus almallahensis TaxID=1379154 RepID=UPI00141FB9B4|nr:DUF86 domain-containing protein [Alkalibacillus almallahensis]